MSALNAKVKLEVSVLGEMQLKRTIQGRIKAVSNWGIILFRRKPHKPSGSRNRGNIVLVFQIFYGQRLGCFKHACLGKMPLERVSIYPHYQ